MTSDGGVPDMTGGEFVAALRTLIENAGKRLTARPSDTLITMLACKPISAVLGVPLNSPVNELNTAHDGIPEMLKLRGS